MERELLDRAHEALEGDVLRLLERLEALPTEEEEEAEEGARVDLQKDKQRKKHAKVKRMKELLSALWRKKE